LPPAFSLGLWLIWNVKRINCLRSATGNKTTGSQELSGGLKPDLRHCMPHLGTRLIRGNRVSLAVHRQALKTIFDSALLLLRPRKFSGGAIIIRRNVICSMARGPLSALARGGGDVRGDFRCRLFSCGFAALGQCEVPQARAGKPSTRRRDIDQKRDGKSGSGFNRSRLHRSSSLNDTG